jgi:hypothetical protein
MRTSAPAGAAFAAVALAAALSVGAGPGTSARPPASSFTARVDNPWFPLRPGSTYVYRGRKDGRAARDVMTVTHVVARIDGVPCVVVRDRLWLDGRLEERTTDWYSQDAGGNVWYFGEDTAELDRHGRVTNTDGTWRAGRNGGRSGIFMFAHPRVGQQAQQEYTRGQAADHFAVVRLGATVRAPYVSSRHALLTKEWTPLEPGVLDHKLYVRGVGTVLEQTVRGGDERLELVSLRRL